jgi:hypothetical protein
MSVHELRWSTAVCESSTEPLTEKNQDVTSPKQLRRSSPLTAVLAVCSRDADCVSGTCTHDGKAAVCSEFDKTKHAAAYLNGDS